jgi:hypothetical protein
MCETGTDQQVAQLLDSYMMVVVVMKMNNGPQNPIRI